VPRPFPATRSDADRRRLRHLWATDLARVRLGSNQTQIFTLDGATAGFIRRYPLHHRQGMRRIRHKRLQLQALGRSGPGVY